VCSSDLKGTVTVTSVGLSRNALAPIAVTICPLKLPGIIKSVSLPEYAVTVDVPSS